MSDPERTYRVDERLLAGTYPAPKLAALLAAGVTTFVDLTEDGDLPDYRSSLPAGVAHHRIDVPDFTAPQAGQIREAIDLIERSEGLVYLHCQGGCGRTGTVAACYLVEHGLAPEAALARLHELTRAVSSRPCPEGADQIATVLGWGA